jgi:hypothetical protein
MNHDGTTREEIPMAGPNTEVASLPPQGPSVVAAMEVPSLSRMAAEKHLRE